MATMTLNHSIKVGQLQMVNLDVHVKQIGPSYVHLFVNTTFGPMVILQMITPIEPFVQKVVHLFYAPRSLAWLTKFTFLGESIMVFIFHRINILVLFNIFYLYFCL